MPGVNASLDHKIPTSRGGNNDLPNLQWVDMQINFVKNALTHDEFVEFCVAIAIKFGGERLVESRQNVSA